MKYHDNLTRRDPWIQSFQTSDVKDNLPYFVGTTDSVVYLDKRGNLHSCTYDVKFTPAIDIYYKIEGNTIYSYNSHFFKKHTPDAVKVHNCHGNNCGSNVYKTGVWCESCRGDINDYHTSMVCDLLKDITVSDIPVDCISSIIRNEDDLTADYMNWLLESGIVNDSDIIDMLTEKIRVIENNQFINDQIKQLEANYEATIKLADSQRAQIAGLRKSLR